MILIHKPKGVACDQKHIENLKSKFRFGVVLTINPGEEASINRYSNTTDYFFPEDKELIIALGYVAPQFPVINASKRKNTNYSRTFFFHEGIYKKLASDADHFLNEIALELSPSGFSKSLAFLVDEYNEFAIKIIKDTVLRSKNTSWKNENGVFYSNNDYLYKQYVAPSSSSTGYHNVSCPKRKMDSIKPPSDEIITTVGGSLTLRVVSEGLKRHFRTLSNVYVEASNHQEIIPLDFISKYNGIHNPSIEYFRSLLRENKQEPLTIEIARFDNLDRDTPPRKLAIFNVKI